MPGTARSEGELLYRINNWVEKVVDVRTEYEACFPWLKQSMVKKIYSPTYEALNSALNADITNIAAKESISSKLQTLKELEETSTRTKKWRPPRDVHAHLRPLRIQAKKQYLAILLAMLDVKTDTYNENVAQVDKILSQVRDKTRQLNAVCDSCEPRLSKLATIEQIVGSQLDKSPLYFDLME